jgi:hypothetical protein
MELVLPGVDILIFVFVLMVTSAVVFIVAFSFFVFLHIALAFLCFGDGCFGPWSVLGLAIMWLVFVFAATTSSVGASGLGSFSFRLLLLRSFLLLLLFTHRCFFIKITRVHQTNKKR